MRAASIPTRIGRSTSRSTGRPPTCSRSTSIRAGASSSPFPSTPVVGSGGLDLELVLPVRTRRPAEDDDLPVRPRGEDDGEAREPRPHEVLRPARGGGGAVRDMVRLRTAQLRRVHPRYRHRSDEEDPRSRWEASIRADRRRGRGPRLLRPIGPHVRFHGPHHAARVGDLAAAPVGLLTLPVGVDVGGQMSLEHVGARVDLWFSRYRCAPQQGDIYRIRDVGIA